MPDYIIKPTKTVTTRCIRLNTGYVVLIVVRVRSGSGSMCVLANVEGVAAEPSPHWPVLALTQHLLYIQPRSPTESADLWGSFSVLLHSQQLGLLCR